MVPAARKLDRISYDEMIEMASLGAQGSADPRGAVRHALRRPALHVRSSFKPDEGTWVVPEEEVMERLVVSGVTYNRDEAKIRVRRREGSARHRAPALYPARQGGIVVDMIIQNVSQRRHRRT